MLPPAVGNDDDDALDAVIVVKRPNSLSRKSGSRNKSDSPSNKRHTSVGGGGRSRKHSCRCQHGDRMRLQRHNATQTPDSILSCNQLHSCHRHSTALDCCDNHKNANHHHCDLMNNDLKTGEITCHCHITHHCHRYSPVSGGSGGGVCNNDGKENSGRKSSHEHSRRSQQKRHNFHHHQRHQQQQLDQQQQHHNHHHHHHYRQLQAELQTTKNANFNNIRQLPAYNNSKSSYDSSDDLQQISDLDAAQQEHLQEIAIEIDAATMTEGNTSTATSNFAYKMAMGNMVAAPIIMAPLHDHYADGKRQHRQKYSRRRRCDSMNSNSTGETDELSRSKRTETVDEERDLYNTNKRTKTDKRRTEDDTTPQQLICCDDSMCCITNTGDMMRKHSTGAPAYNECPKIQRKRFKASAADDCCSTCSHCTNCSCLNADATSCSSIDDLDADEEDYENRQHEMIVAADCHRCNFHRRSTTTSEEAVDEKEEDGSGSSSSFDKDEKLSKKTGRPKNHANSSAHTSRRSSASYCSCHSNTCYCCECNYSRANEADDDDDACDTTTTTGQMCTARDTSCTPLTSAAAGVDYDAEHSSTLTPLTNASSSVATTPGADDVDLTLRSLNNTLTEDVASSLSQSAEYFSLSSSNQQSQQLTPADTPARRTQKLHSEGGCSTLLESKRNCNTDDAELTACSRKPCKHYIKHHRHKRSTSPLDGYL